MNVFLSVLTITLVTTVPSLRAQYNLGETFNSQFNKYWPLINQFLDCTVHLSRSKSSWLELFHSVLHLCHQQNRRLPCVSIHTLSPSDVTTNPKFSPNQSSYWNATNFRDISPIFTFVFSHVKNSHQCVLELPQVSQVNVNFYQADRRQCSKYYSKCRWIHPPNFVLIPISKRMDHTQIHGFFGNYYRAERAYHRVSRISLLHSEIFYVAGMCLKCFISEPDYNENIHWKEIKSHQTKLPRAAIVNMLDSTKTFRDIRTTHFKCPYSNLDSDISYNAGALYLCMLEIFSWQHNLTTFLDFVTPENTLYNSNYNHIFSIGSYDLGFRYTIFLKRRNQSSFVDSYFSLLSPFGWKGWLVVIISLLYYGCILKLTQQSISPYFWLIGTLLEQCDDTRENINWKNWYLVAIWLLMVIIVRMAYTSAIFTYMAKEAGPGYVPESLNDLVYNTDISLHTSWLTKNALEYRKQFESSDHSSFRRLFRKVLDALVGTDLRQWGSVSLQMLGVDLGNLGCTRYGFQRPQNQPGNGDIFRIDGDRYPCRNFEKFAIFHISDDDLYTPEFSDSSIAKLNINLMNAYHIVENQDENFAPRRYVWCTYMRTTYHDEFEKFLSSIIEAGIYTLQLSYASNENLKQHILKALYPRFNEAKANLLLRAYNQWSSLRCFKFYKQACSPTDLLKNRLEVNEDRVQNKDLISLWLVFLLLESFSICVFITSLQLNKKV